MTMLNNNHLTLLWSKAIIFLLDMSVLIFISAYRLADKLSSYLKRLRSNSNNVPR